MSLITLALIIIGGIAVFKACRKSFKKHPFLWVLGVIAVVAILIIF